MNVMINDISKDLDTTVQGVQVAITIFLLVMAALMIPGGKLTDRYGRVRLFRLGLVVYGVGALLSAAAPGLGVLIIGNSILEGVGRGCLSRLCTSSRRCCSPGSLRALARSALSVRWAALARRQDR